MWKIPIPALLIVGLFVLSCDRVEEKPEMQESLADSNWLVTGYLPSSSNVLQVSPATYRLDFINDSTFILYLDVTRIVGKYSATQNGEFWVGKIKQTHACCDSEYALQMAEIIQHAGGYRTTRDGISLRGAGEVFLKKK